MNPKVSIIIPFFNAEQYISRCAKSLFEQTLDSIEFVFVNDCSTDSSVLVLKNLIKLYPDRKEAVKIVCHQKNLGSAASRNTGLNHVKGEFVGWVDSDDWVKPEMFKVLYDISVLNRADLIWCNFYKAFPDKNIETIQDVALNNIIFIQSLISGRVEGMLWNKLMRHSIIKNNNIRFLEGNDLGEDKMFLIKYLYHSRSIIFENSSLYFYVINKNISITRDPKISRVYEEINNAKSICDFLTEKEVNQVSNHDLNNFKFKSKQKLLFTDSEEAIIDWAGIFPETNNLVRGSSLRFRHKQLAYSSIRKNYFSIKLWCYIKSVWKCIKK